MELERAAPDAILHVALCLSPRVEKEAYDSPPLFVIDVHDSAAPTLVLSIDLTIYLLEDYQPVGRLALVGRTLYIASAKLMTFDLANPARPVKIGEANLTSNLAAANDLADVPGYLFVAAGERGLRVLDVHNPAAVTEVASFVPGNGDNLTDLVVEGDRLYSFSEGSLNHGVLRVFSIVAPAELERLGSLTGVGGSGEIAFSDGRLLWAGETSLSPGLTAPKLRSYDVSNPSSFHELSASALDEQPYQLTVAAGISLLHTRTERLARLRLDDLGKPVVTGYYAPPRYVDYLDVSGEWALVAGLELTGESPSTSNRATLLRLGDRRLPMPVGGGDLVGIGRLQFAGDRSSIKVLHFNLLCRRNL